MAVQIAVIGSGAENEASAEEVGRLIAEGGATLVCGGLDEVMEAAARGARRAGGVTIGILPGESKGAASPWIDHVVVTGMGHARNLAVAASGDAVIAVGGGYGTLSEIAYARILGRPVVALEGGWQLEREGIAVAATPGEAVQLALRLASGGDVPASG
ncbi:MAG TPA: TIGR00725 family protein [Gaiellaceae bacterium]|nr:TIGR00725 family protein [Gaiellaceae bacterium]